MDFDLTKEQKLLQRTVMEFSRQEIEPIAREIYTDNKLPDDLIKKLASLRLLGMTIPEEYGGAGLNSLDCALAIEQLSYFGTEIWRLAAFNNSIPEVVLKSGTDGQKQKYLPPACSGDAYAGIQFTDQDAIRIMKDPETEVELNRSHYVVNSDKLISTFGARDGFAVLFIKDKDSNFTAFIADKNISGYSAKQIQSHGSERIEAAEIYYKNYRLPEENMLGTPGKGAEILQRWISDVKIQQCAACLGIAGAAIVDAMSCLNIRTTKNGIQPDVLKIKSMLTEMQSKLNASKWVTYRAAILKDKKDPDWMAEAAAAKMFVAPAAMKIVELSRRIHKINGRKKEFRIEMLHRAIAGASANSGQS